jgi:hypothetical protein
MVASSMNEWKNEKSRDSSPLAAGTIQYRSDPAND